MRGGFVSTPRKPKTPAATLDKMYKRRTKAKVDPLIADPESEFSKIRAEVERGLDKQELEILDRMSKYAWKMVEAKCSPIMVVGHTPNGNIGLTTHASYSQ